MTTDRRLWRWCAIAAFIALGFVSPLGEETSYKTGPKYFWGALCHYPVSSNPSEGYWWVAMAGLLLFALVVAVAALLAGWILQAFIVSGREWLRAKVQHESN